MVVLGQLWTPVRIPTVPTAGRSLLLHFAPWAVIAGQEALGASGCALGKHGSCSNSLFSGLGEWLGLQPLSTDDTVPLVLSKSL